MNHFIIKLHSKMILNHKPFKMINFLNQMLIALALFDSGYLFGSILESFRKSFQGPILSKLFFAIIDGAIK